MPRHWPVRATIAARPDGADTLEGGSGLDLLVGGEGEDRLVGWDGDDRLIGRGGAQPMPSTSFMS
jgi:Ca2+-binding RTX toxin-like protein